MLRDRKQRKIENERYERQLKDSRNNWHMQNAYNSPSAQMARLKAAGLNPNMIYQNGGALTGAGEIGSTDFQTTPYSDYSSMVDKMLQADSVQSQIQLNEANRRKSTAEALGIEADNGILDKTTLRGLGNMETFQLLNEEERKYYADLFGMTPEQVSSKSLRWFNYASQLRSLMNNNNVSEQTRKNLKETFNILEHEESAALHNSERAFLAQILDQITLGTEAEKHGYKVKYDGLPTSFVKDPNKLNYALEYFIRTYKEMHWQSSDVKHTLDQLHQTLDHIPGLRRNPLLQGVEEQYSNGGKHTFYHYSKHK